MELADNWELHKKMLIKKLRTPQKQSILLIKDVYMKFNIKILLMAILAFGMSHMSASNLHAAAITAIKDFNAIRYGVTQKQDVTQEKPIQKTREYVRAKRKNPVSSGTHATQENTVPAAGATFEVNPCTQILLDSMQPQAAVSQPATKPSPLHVRIDSEAGISFNKKNAGSTPYPRHQPLELQPTVFNSDLFPAMLGAWRSLSNATPEEKKAAAERKKSNKANVQQAISMQARDGQKIAPARFQKGAPSKSNHFRSGRGNFNCGKTRR